MDLSQDQAAFDHDSTPRRRRRGLIALLLIFSLATVGAGVFSLAIFTDSNAVDGTWTAGTIDIEADADGSATFSVSGLMPGDTGEQTITVDNAGTAQLRYALTTSATNGDGKGLQGQLDLTVREGACPSTGTELFAGKVGAAAFGDPAQGADTGDRVLAAATSEDLCFAWSLDIATGNAFQGATTTATFTFDAEQTANNPATP